MLIDIKQIRNCPPAFFFLTFRVCSLHEDSAGKLGRMNSQLIARDLKASIIALELLKKEKELTTGLKARIKWMHRLAWTELQVKAPHSRRKYMRLPCELHTKSQIPKWFTFKWVTIYMRSKLKAMYSEPKHQSHWYDRSYLVKFNILGI